ncbi:MAG: YceI family protein [Candidatus Delongbacteria bacterium]
MRRILIPLALLLALSQGAVAAARTFVIQPGKAWNQVTFHSEATVESFDGKTRQVSGQLTVDPEALGQGSSAWFQVELKSLDTGMSLRNKHMRENHLHTDKYPLTRFELRSLSVPVAALAPGKTTRVTASGEYSLHGVTRPRTLPVDVTWFPDGSQTPAKARGPVLHVVCRYDVGLAEHGIPRPEFLFMKVAEQMQVTVDLWAVVE